MERRDDAELNRDVDSTVGDGETHATTGGAAAAGAVTGGVIGLTGGPIGAAIGAVGGAIVGAAAERMMHSDDDAEREHMGLDNDRDRNALIEDRGRTDVTAATTTAAIGSTGSTGVRDDTLADRSPVNRAGADIEGSTTGDITDSSSTGTPREGVFVDRDDDDTER
jgi:outer membrane lipoprotein SlyB